VARLSNPELKQSAYSYGWDAILTHFGIESACLDSRNNKRSHCPICGGDKHSNHFDYRNKSPDETYHCFKCGGGDGFKLLYQFNGTSFGTVAKLIRGNTSSVPASKPVATTTTANNHKPDEDKEKAKKLARFEKAVNKSKYPPKQWGIEYLAGRGIKFTNQNNRRFIKYGKGWYLDRFLPRADNSKESESFNCLVFPLSRYDTGLGGIVRIYPDWDKIKIALLRNGDSKDAIEKMPKKPMLNHPAKPEGMGVWFNKTINSGVLHVGEGIENTLSILQSLKTLDGVASVTAGLMGKLVIQSHITEMHIWADNGDAGQANAFKLKERYDTQADVIIHTPKQGMDWNDILINEGEGAIQEEFNSARL
jgi:hypothetical protein